MLQGSQCFTCTVGMKISKAQYYVEDTDAVVNMMQVCRFFRVDFSEGLKRADSGAEYLESVHVYNRLWSAYFLTVSMSHAHTLVASI